MFLAHHALTLISSALRVVVRLLRELLEHKIVVSSAYKMHSDSVVRHCGRSLMYNRNKSGPRIEPCGTPMLIIFLVE